MKKPIIQFGRRRIVVVSTFSGMDLFLLGCIKAGLIPGFGCERNFWASLIHRANFKDSNGNPLVEFVNISKDEFDNYNAIGDQEIVGIDDGQYVRTKSIQEYDGSVIREKLENIYGKDVLILLIGGPPCTDYTKLNKNKRQGSSSRNFLVFEYFRFFSELNPDIAIMEEVPEFGEGEGKIFYDEFMEKARALPYQIGEQVMNSLHYGGNQSRWRRILFFVHNKWETQPVFPIGNVENCKRVQDFLDIDYFFSGHFTDKIKNKRHFMCTVTSGSPQYFWKDKVRYSPRIDQLLLCMDAEAGEYTIPNNVPQEQIRKCIGNGVTVSVAYALAKSVVDNIFRIKPDIDGYWVSIDPTNDTAEEPVNPVVNQSTETAAERPSEPTTNTTKPVLHSNPNYAGSRSKSRIISSRQLMAMNFLSYVFEGEWLNFIGQPSINFNCVIHGMPGHGKSTFSIQFAKYLATIFGRTLYISGEEGISKTLQNKVANSQAGDSDIHFVDLKNYDDIVREVPKDYKFIFIDSLDNMKIGTLKMRQLKLQYPSTAFITISQSTKNGLIRGSNEIVHDADITIIVVEGVAYTTKNRFAPINATYRIF